MPLPDWAVVALAAVIGISFVAGITWAAVSLGPSDGAFRPPARPRTRFLKWLRRRSKFIAD